MVVRIHLDERADCLIGATVVMDGRHVGRLTGRETELPVARGWHVLEVHDPFRPTRALHFHTRADHDVDARVRLFKRVDYLDCSRFELVAA